MSQYYNSFLFPWTPNQTVNQGLTIFIKALITVTLLINGGFILSIIMYSIYIPDPVNYSHCFSYYLYLSISAHKD